MINNKQIPIDKNPNFKQKMSGHWWLCWFNINE